MNLALEELMGDMLPVRGPANANTYGILITKFGNKFIAYTGLMGSPFNTKFTIWMQFESDFELNKDRAKPIHYDVPLYKAMEGILEQGPIFNRASQGQRIGDLSELKLDGLIIEVKIITRANGGEWYIGPAEFSNAGNMMVSARENTAVSNALSDPAFREKYLQQTKILNKACAGFLIHLKGVAEDCGAVMLAASVPLDDRPPIWLFESMGFTKVPEEPTVKDCVVMFLGLRNPEDFKIPLRDRLANDGLRKMYDSLMALEALKQAGKVESELKICPNCEIPIERKNKFCTHCGAKQEADDVL